MKATNQQCLPPLSIQQLQQLGECITEVSQRVYNFNVVQSELKGAAKENCDELPHEILSFVLSGEEVTQLFQLGLEVFAQREGTAIGFSSQEDLAQVNLFLGICRGSQFKGFLEGLVNKEQLEKTNFISPLIILAQCFGQQMSNLGFLTAIDKGVNVKELITVIGPVISQYRRLGLSDGVKDLEQLQIAAQEGYLFDYATAATLGLIAHSGQRSLPLPKDLSLSEGTELKGWTQKVIQLLHKLHENPGAYRFALQVEESVKQVIDAHDIESAKGVHLFNKVKETLTLLSRAPWHLTIPPVH